MNTFLNHPISIKCSPECISGRGHGLNRRLVPGANMFGESDSVTFCKKLYAATYEMNKSAKGAGLFPGSVT